MSLQAVTRPLNIALKDGFEDLWLAKPLAELTGHKIEPVHHFDVPEGIGFEFMDVGGEGIAERPHLGTI